MVNHNLQAILFDKSKWSSTQAMRWLKKYDFVPIKKAHVTKNYRRYRLVEPKESFKYRTIRIGKDTGILGIQILKT